MRKIADRVNIITPIIVMDRQLTIDSKLPRILSKNQGKLNFF
jgi:hypothetical protein